VKNSDKILKEINRIEKSARTLFKLNKTLDSQISLTKFIETLDIYEQIAVVKWLAKNGKWEVHSVSGNVSHYSLKTYAFEANLGVVSEKGRLNTKDEKIKKFTIRQGTLLALGFYYNNHPHMNSMNKWEKELFNKLFKFINTNDFLENCK
jgi:hypothetical protein